MSILKRLLDIYIGASLHVAFAVFALVRMTQHMFAIENHDAMGWFAFFSTVAGYNFVKYHSLVWQQNWKLTPWTRTVARVSVIAMMLAFYYFWHLSLAARAVTGLFAVLTVLYALPFFPNRTNARNWAGVKIYIVSICWAGVTVVLPMLDAGMAFTVELMFKCLQRFILIFVLILIFEIVDLRKDDPLLKTVPQQIGVRRTKWLGMALLVIFFLLEIMQTQNPDGQWLANTILVAVTGAFLAGASEQRSRYYSALWVEAIPILWWAMIAC